MSKINKIITNKPITLTQEEVANLSETLSAVRTAGGGGGGGATYGGDGRYIEITGNNTITLTTTAANQLDRVIPTKVSDLEDASDYATVESLTAYQAAGNYLSANALNSLSGTWETVTAKLDETEFAEVSGDFLTEASLNDYATETYVQTASAGITGWVNDQGYLKTIPDTYYLKTETSGKDELSAAFNDILKYNVTAAAGIEITTATDAGVKTFGISMTAEPVVTDTTLSGYNGIAATRDGEINNQWNIGLTQDITNTINGKLNSSDFTTYTGTTAPNTYLTKTSADTLYQPTGDYVTTADVLTGTDNILTGIKIGSTNYTIPTTDLSNYYTKTQVDSTFASASQLNSYLTTAQYQTDSASFALKTDTSSKNELSTEFAKYTKTEDLNIPTKVSDLTDSADYAKKTDLDGFVTSSNITTQDTDYVMTTTGWKVLTLPGGGITQVIHDTTLTGQGNDNNSKLGVAWSALSGNTINSAKSADVAMYYYDTVNNMPIGISTAINGIYNQFDNCLLTGDIMPDNGISGGYNTQAQVVELGLTQTAYNAVTAVSSKLDKPTNLSNGTYSLHVAGGTFSWQNAVDPSTVLYSDEVLGVNGVSANWVGEYFNIGLTNDVYSAIQQISAANDLVGANGISVVTGLNNQIIIEPSGISPAKQYAMTTTGWAEVQAGTTFTGVTTAGSISGDGLTNPLGLKTSAENALTAVAEKLNITAAEQTYQTIAGMSNYLTTTDAATTYLDKTTYATDKNTFVTSSNSTIIGTDKYALTTTGWASVETAYLPLTGGTVTGQMTLTGNSWDNRLTIGRSNTAIDIGVALNGALTLKANVNNACQFNMMQTGTSGVDINITYGQTPTAIGNLYVMKTHTTAEATTASGSWNGDNLLHIILDS